MIHSKVYDQYHNKINIYDSFKKINTNNDSMSLNYYLRNVKNDIKIDQVN